MTDKLQKAITLIRSGDRREAGRLLSEKLQSNPQNELAWLWLSSVAANAEQRAYCLKKVLEINPSNQQAPKGMERLGHNPKAHPVGQVVSGKGNRRDSRERVKSGAGDRKRQEIPGQCPNCGGNLDSVLKELHGGALDKLLECPYCGFTIDVPDQMIFSNGSGAPELIRSGATRSCASSCCDCHIISTHGDMAGRNPVVCNRYSIQACVIRKTVPSGTLMGCEALETKVSRVQSDGNGTARDVATASTRRLGARVAWYG